MDASADGSLAGHPGAGRPGPALPDLPSGPGWLVLRDCPLGGGGPPVDLALLHPKFGVALVHFAETRSDAVGRFKRALHARCFPAIFGDYPPVVRAVVPADRLADLGALLSARFRAEPPPSLMGGDAWMPTARAALEAEPAPGDGRGPPAAASEENVASWRKTFLVLASAVSIGVLAAAAVIPAPQETGGPPPEPKAPAPPRNSAAAPTRPPAPPQRSAEAPTRPPASRPPQPAGERAAAPEVVAPRPADATGDGDRAAAPEVVASRPAPRPADATGGGDRAAVRQESGGGPPPVAAPTDERRTEPPPPRPAPAGAEPPPAERPEPVAVAAPPPNLQPGAVADPFGEPGPPARAPLAGRAAAAPVRATPAAAAAAPQPAPAAAEATGERRCRAILVRTTLGEGLSDADKQHLRRGCQQQQPTPRN